MPRSLRPAVEPCHLLHNQHQQQLSPSNLRPFDDQWATLAKLGICFQQEFFLFVKFQVQNVACLGFTLRINVQHKKFADSKPIFLPSLECLLRLADHLKLIIAESSSQ